MRSFIETRDTAQMGHYRDYRNFLFSLAWLLDVMSGQSLVTATMLPRM